MSYTVDQLASVQELHKSTEVMQGSGRQDEFSGRRTAPSNEGVTAATTWARKSCSFVEGNRGRQDLAETEGRARGVPEMSHTSGREVGGGRRSYTFGAAPDAGDIDVTCS